MSTIKEIIDKTQAYYCLDCGKCTGVCPVSRENKDFSPRSMLMRVVQKDHESLLDERSLWECLTCGMCEEWCPSKIKYIHFIQELRSLAINVGEKAECSHGGAFQSIMRMMTADNLQQNRMEWVTDDLQTSQKSDVFFFVGCTPFFDTYFTDLNIDTLDAAKGTIKLLNKVGIKPVVSPDERCCGHDLLWSGDFENFKKLGQKNIELIEKSGAKTVVFSCPECYQAFKQDYPAYIRKFNFEVKHITEFIAPYLESKKISFSEKNEKVTFHDPCRLSRHLGIQDAPRNLIEAVPELNLSEMAHNRRRAICCGVGNWLTCGAANKAIQVRRLKEAQATGAKTMLSSCPKCEIHLKCALSDDKLQQEIKVDIKDLMSYVAEVIK